MIVVLCESFQEAKESFQYFLEYLNGYDSFLIKSVNRYANWIETIEDLKYVFIDYRFAKCYRDVGVDFIGHDCFFEDADFYYENCGRV